MAPVTRSTSRNIMRQTRRGSSHPRAHHVFNNEPIEIPDEEPNLMDDDVEVLSVKPPAESGTKENPIVLGVGSPSANEVEMLSDGTTPSVENLMTLNRHLAESLQCVICADIIYKCVTVFPCAHKFCAGCLSAWIMHAMTCPICRKNVIAAKRDAVVDGIIEHFFQANPEKRRSNEDHERLDAADSISPLPQLNADVLLMIELPCYVRIQKANNDTQTGTTSVDEDEIVYLTCQDGEEWYVGSRLSGEYVRVHKENFYRLELPDPRLNELYFVASIAEYDSYNRSDISFGKYTVVIVSKELDENWYEGTVIGANGKRLGKAGYFPKSFVVRLIRVQDNQPKASLGGTAATNLDGTPDLHSKIERYDEPPQILSDTECDASSEKVIFRDMGRASQTSTSTTTDRIYAAHSMHPFMGSDVSKLSSKSVHTNDKTCGALQQHKFADLLSDPVAMHSRSLSSSPANIVGMARVQFDFTARQDDELSVSTGDSISVMKMVNDEWAFCFNPANSRCGIVPLSFLHVFENDDDEDDSSESADVEQTAPIGSMEFASTSNQTSTAQQVTIDASQLDAFFGFSSGGEVQSTARITPINESFAFEQKNKKIAPARPPPPKLSVAQLKRTEALCRPVSLPALANTSQTLSDEAEPGLDMETIRQRIVEELICSELQYLSDIGMWQVEIENCPRLSAQHKALFTNGIPELKELSKRLIEQLTQQKSNPPEKQCYGYAFMQMRDDFMTTFALHFRSVEAISLLIETELNVQSALNECVAEMRSLGSNVFDVHTIVSRPIQRCLKYPLFIAELIKITPISHMDHPKLLEALKQMSVLASKMNESKRRKELAQKYRATEQESFSKRLSKLNMHTVKKKSNRFRYRLTSQIGLVRMQSDPAFDTIAHSLEISERRVCRFLHAVQLYKHLISSQTKRYVDIYTTNDKLSANTDKINAEIRGFCKNLLQEANNLNAFLDSTAVQEANKYLRLPVTRMIQKRYDKLIDFESAKRSDKNANDLRVKQGDYEALNNQLKMTLPKIIQNINNRTFALVDSVISKDEQFFATVAQLRDQLSVEVCAFFIMPYRHFVDPYECRLRSLIAIGRMASEARVEQLFRKSTVQLTSSGSSSKNLQKGMQTERERDAIVRIMRSQGTQSLLVSVVQRWPPDVVPGVDDQLCVERGDILMVLTKGTQQQPWLCDNGITKGYVPSSCLVAYTEAEKASDHQQLRQSDSVQRSSCQPETVNTNAKTGETNLIDLEENLLDLNSPIKAQPAPTFPLAASSSPLIVSEKAPPVVVSPTNPFLGDVLDSAPQTDVNTGEGMRLDSSDAIFGDLFQDAKAAQLSSISNRANSPITRVPLIPVRPTQKDAGLTNEQCTIRKKIQDESGPKRMYYAPITSPSTPQQDVEFFKAEYDFDGADDIQLSIVEGEKLRVLKKSDDEGNTAWWMVENEVGMIGYVPANYLSSLS